MNEVVIKARENGLYKVTGSITLIDADGTRYDLSDRGEAVALCRCGRFDDETVLRRNPLQIGFAAAERAVREQR